MLTVSSNARNNTAAEAFDEAKLLAMKTTEPDTCAVCGLSVQSKPFLIKCDVCKEYWHIDCIEPVTRLERPSIGVREEKVGNRMQFLMKKKFFMCPRHVAQDFKMFGNVKIAEKGDAPTNPRAFKLRTFKNPTTVDVPMERGFANNGAEIDVIVDESEKEDSDVDEDDMDPGFVPGLTTENVRYRVHEISIKQDFLIKAKR